MVGKKGENYVQEGKEESGGYMLESSAAMVESCATIRADVDLQLPL